MSTQSDHSQRSAEPTSGTPAHNAQMQKFTTPVSLAIDAVLVIAFFAFMFSIVSPHVQSENPVFIALWGGGATACMSAVFWLAIQMFRVVLKAQLAGKK